MTFEVVQRYYPCVTCHDTYIHVLVVRLDDDKENTICKVSDMETRIS